MSRLAFENKNRRTRKPQKIRTGNLFQIYLQGKRIMLSTKLCKL